MLIDKKQRHCYQSICHLCWYPWLWSCNGPPVLVLAMHQEWWTSSALSCKPWDPTGQVARDQPNNGLLFNFCSVYQFVSQDKEDNYLTLPLSRANFETRLDFQIQALISSSVRALSRWRMGCPLASSGNDATFASILDLSLAMSLLFQCWQCVDIYGHPRLCLAGYGIWHGKLFKIYQP